MNPIQKENCKPGTTSWQINKPSKNQEIEGFASATSVFLNESIKFYVSCKNPTFSLQIYRMGWYEGAGGRLIDSISDIKAISQPLPDIDQLKKVECFWDVSYELLIPDDWCTGIYLCKIISTPDLYESYIIFSVKQKLDDSSSFLFQISTNTYQAYNTWGNYSLYGDSTSALADSHSLRAKSVSFNRPYIEGNGAGQFFFWEYQLLRWIEKNGLDVSYCSNNDLHENKFLLTKTKAFLSTGHDEYWSKEMYDHIEESLHVNKMGAAFFCADAVYWQIRYEDSFNGKNRNIVCYKCNEHTPYKDDPIFKTNHKLVTAKFRDRHVNRPEQKLIGQMYGGWFSNKEPNGDLIITTNSHPIFKNTGIEIGDKFPKLIGYEFDKVWRNFPKPDNLIKLAESPVEWNRPNDVGHGVSHVTIYTNSEKNSVFASGTTSWNFSLDSYGHVNDHLVSEKLQKLTLNILKFISKTEDNLEYSFFEEEIKNKNSENITNTHHKKPAFKFVKYSWWVCGIIGFLLRNNLSSVPNNKFLTVFIGIIDGVFLGYVLGFVIDKLNASKK
jgi:hypothetical protein